MVTPEHSVSASHWPRAINKYSEREKERKRAEGGVEELANHLD